MQNRLSYSSQTPIFPNFHIFTYFSRILLFAFSLLFFKKIAGKIGAALHGKMDLISEIASDASIVVKAMFCWCVKFTDALLGTFNILWSLLTFYRNSPKEVWYYFPYFTELV